MIRPWLRNQKDRTMRVFAVCVLPFMLNLSATAEWSESATVDYRDEVVVSYRAQLAGEYLIVEAVHAEGWHTYSMDNVERARERTGKERPETELPTRISVEGSLKVTGAWRQSPPKDLSQAEIHWYTWGFEERAIFAVNVVRSGSGSATITIDGQACNASRCRMVDRITIDISSTGSAESASVEQLLADLVEVRKDESEETEKD